MVVRACAAMELVETGLDLDEGMIASGRAVESEPKGVDGWEGEPMKQRESEVFEEGSEFSSCLMFVMVPSCC